MEIFKVQRRTRKLLEELDSIAIEKDRVHLIESRAEHLIASATNLIDMIRNSYDCLLYTSPSPRDKTVSRMPSSA